MPDSVSNGAPVVPRLRHNARTRAGVIAEFRRTGRVDMACASMGVDRTSHYVWMKKFPKYAEAFENARTEVAGLLEDEAVRRAYHGTLKPVSIGGKVVVVTEFSDQILMMLLKCRNKPVFGDRMSLEHTGKDGKPLMPLVTARALLHEDPDSE